MLSVTLRTQLARVLPVLVVGTAVTSLVAGGTAGVSTIASAPAPAVASPSAATAAATTSGVVTAVVGAPSAQNTASAPRATAGVSASEKVGAASPKSVASAATVPVNAVVAAAPAAISPHTDVTAPAAPVADVPTVSNCSTPLPGQAACMSVVQTDPQAAPAVTQDERRSTTIAVPKNDAVKAIASGDTSANATANAVPRGYGPTDLASAYKLNSALGTGATVAIVDAYDDPTAEADLATYRSTYGLPACTSASGCFTKVNQSGTASPLPAANSGWAGEISLDLDMVSAVCPNCKILLVEANDSYMNNLGTAVNTAVRLGAKYVSNSYGGGDSSSDAALDSAYYNHPGVVITASAGDNGYGAAYPATGQYVTAVGGTTLTTSTSARGWGESAWSGSGSGCSTNETKPSFQTSITTGCTGRAESDVSAVANPSTGVAVSYNGGWGVYGGTSVAAPIIAAVYALAGTPGSTDRPNTYPYRSSTSLFDVTSGTNGTCPTPQWCTSAGGWDGPTGLGTPNGTAAFSPSGTTTPTPTPTPAPTATPTPVPTATPVPLSAALTAVGTPIAGIANTLNLATTMRSGDSIASVAWSSSRTDCQFSASTNTGSKVSCSVSSTASTTITAKVTDTLGATATSATVLTFATPSPARAVSVALSVAGQTGTAQTACVGASNPVLATVIDTATGLPVLGASVAFTQQIGTAAATSLGSVISLLTGVAANKTTPTASVTLAASTTAVNGFAAQSGSLAVSAIKCTLGVTVATDKTSLTAPDKATLTGVVNRSTATAVVPMPGVTVAVTGPGATTGSTVSYGSVVTAADGSYSLAVAPTTSGVFTAAVAAGTSWNAAQVSTATIAVTAAGTKLTAVASSLNVGYGTTVVLSGSLLRTIGTTSTALAGSVVTISGVATGAAARTLGSAVVTASGTWSFSLAATAGMTLTASYAGVTNQPAASTAIGALTVGTWTSAVSLKSQYTVVGPGVWNLFTGTATKTYNGSTSPLAGVWVSFYVKATNGASVLLGSVLTAADGSFGAYVMLGSTNTVSVAVAAGTGFGASTSTPIGVTVGNASTVKH